MKKMPKGKIISFVGISFGFTWLMWLPLLINYQFGLNLFHVQGQFYIASSGPLVGAVLSSFLYGGADEFSKWIKRAFSLNFKSKWLIIALFMPVIYGFAGFIAHKLIIGEWPNLHTFGLTKKLPGFNILQTAFIWLITFGLGEESGWRGFLLPELTKKFSVKKSAFIVAFIWILWHLPAFWFNENYIKMGPGMIGWAISLCFGSVLLAWLCKSSRFSIIPVLIWHGGFDLITACDDAEKVIAMICSMLVIFHGIYLLFKMKEN